LQKDRGNLRLEQEIGPTAKTMLRGIERVGAQFILTLAAYNVVRPPRLLAA
jgi:hypothetical protein